MTYPAQTDQRTCGIAALAAFVARNDADNGANFLRYCSASSGDVARLQGDLHRIASWVGMPWPRALGTSPWALATLATRATRRTYRMVAWNASGAEVVREAWAAGFDVMMYTGQQVVPRHVVLLLGRGSAQACPAHKEAASVFEPASGQIFEISPEELTAKRWSGKAGKAHWGWWTRPLMAVVPDLDD